jgi:ABC-type transport system involved in multi-copper enzyme maturation permease subunit
VFRFEWRRALALPRLAWWAALAAFPLFIVVLIRLSPAPHPSREPWAVLFFALVPMLVSMLGAYLWTTPAVSAELERKSWVYLAVRPHGSTALLLGKYLAAVTWVLPAALVGASMAIAAAQTGDGWRIWRTVTGLACLSCPAYAAVFLLLGTLFPRRAMVIAVAYTLVFELVISFVPAMINKLTVQYRLRALLVDWADIPVPNQRQFDALALVGEAPAWLHVSVLAAYTALLLAAAVVLIRFREFSSAEEADV